MSERDDYPHGVPCSVSVLAADVRSGADFYGDLFGWAVDYSEEHNFAVMRLREREAAGVGDLAGAGPDAEAAWITNIRVDDAAAIVEQATAAGGTVLAGPLDLAPAGRLTVIADPAGAVFGAWEALDREGAQVVNEPGAWAMSALLTADADAVLPFYKRLFGWEPEPFGPATMLRLPGYVGGEPEQPVPRDVVAVLLTADGTPRWRPDFWVADADAAAATAERRGGRVLDPVAVQPPFRQARLADPEGAEFTVSQFVGFE